MTKGSSGERTASRPVAGPANREDAKTQKPFGEHSIEQDLLLAPLGIELAGQPSNATRDRVDFASLASVVAVLCTEKRCLRVAARFRRKPSQKPSAAVSNHQFGPNIEPRHIVKTTVFGGNWHW